jgi:hypothetical protein
MNTRMTFDESAKAFIEEGWRKSANVMDGSYDYPASITVFVKATIDGKRKDFTLEIREVSERAKQLGRRFAKHNKEHPATLPPAELKRVTELIKKHTESFRKRGIKV